MEKRIELERRGRPVAEVVDLNLDNCRATQVAGLTDDFVKLEVLSLINVGLTTLKGFPSLPNLKRLELSDNRISSGLNLLQGCRSLTTINLSGNKIKDFETLEPLKGLAELRMLDLFNCDVTNAENYREAIFEMLKGLEYLDGYDRNNEEAEEDEDDEGGGESDDEESNDLGDDHELGEDNDDELGDDDDDDDVDGVGEILNGTGELNESGAVDDDEDDDDDDDDDLDDDDDDLDEDDDEEGSDINGDDHGDDDDESEDDEGETFQQGTKRKREHDEEENGD